MYFEPYLFLPCPGERSRSLGLHFIRIYLYGDWRKTEREEGGGPFGGRLERGFENSPLVEKLLDASVLCVRVVIVCAHPYSCYRELCF